MSGPRLVALLAVIAAGLLDVLVVLSIGPEKEMFAGMIACLIVAIIALITYWPGRRV